MADAGEQPWFKDGLSFECTRCGKCCTGEPGFVWLNDVEITQLAAVVGMTEDEFLKTYTKKYRSRCSLIEKENGDCIFWDSKQGCTVYSHRPRQCRTWPFWESNLETPESWEETCRVCPGSGKGKLYSVEEIIAQSKVVKI